MVPDTGHIDARDVAQSSVPPEFLTIHFRDVSARSAAVFRPHPPPENSKSQIAAEGGGACKRENTPRHSGSAREAAPERIGGRSARERTGRRERRQGEEGDR